jgi:hypothetical protein
MLNSTKRDWAFCCTTCILAPLPGGLSAETGIGAPGELPPLEHADAVTKIKAIIE